MLQAVIRDLGGTIETYFSGAPSTTTVSVYNASGTKKVDEQAATVDSTSTTLAAGAEVGATTFTVASASGMAVGRRYLVGGSDETPEVAIVKGIAGAVITPWAPLMFAHASGVAVKGLRVSYAVSAAAANELWWDGYALFTPTAGLGLEPQVEAVDCVRRMIPYDLIDMGSVRDVLPKAPKALSAELDIPAALRAARDELLLDIGGKNRAHTILGTDQFRRPCALKFWLMRRFELGEEEWGPALDVLQKEYDGLKDRIISQAAVDADQDGATNGPNDRAFVGVRIERA